MADTRRPIKKREKIRNTEQSACMVWAMERVCVSVPPGVRVSLSVRSLYWRTFLLLALCRRMFGIIKSHTDTAASQHYPCLCIPQHIGGKHLLEGRHKLARLQTDKGVTRRQVAPGRQTDCEHHGKESQKRNTLMLTRQEKEHRN